MSYSLKFFWGLFRELFLFFGGFLGSFEKIWGLFRELFLFFGGFLGKKIDFFAYKSLKISYI